MIDVLEKYLEWNKGTLTLNSAESFEGDLSFVQHTNVILCRIDNTIRAFPAQQVETFSIFDGRTNKKRFFVSQEFSLRKKTGKKVFMEVILVGEIPVYRIAKSKNKEDEVPELRDFSYYAFIDNKYVALKDFRKKIFPILLTKSEIQMKKFLKEENLNPHEIGDQIQLVSYFNAVVITKNHDNLELTEYKMNQ